MKMSPIQLSYVQLFFPLKVFQHYTPHDMFRPIWYHHAFKIVVAGNCCTSVVVTAFQYVVPSLR
jgi:hypothetical protein